MSKFILKCKVVKDGLSISISRQAVVFIAENHEEFVDDEGEQTVKVTDATEFIKAVSSEINEEEEDGTTLIHIMLDSAIKRAIENGCEGVELKP